jgi:hypothetical protein
MTDAAPSAPAVLSLLSPGVRRRIFRLARALGRLERTVVDDFPMADALSVQPDLATYFDTTPEDHLLADLLATLRALNRAIEDLQHPISCDLAPLPVADASDLI